MKLDEEVNKTGLQPVSRPVDQVHYFGGWVEGAKSFWCQGFADRQPNRTGGGSSVQNPTNRLTDSYPLT